MTEHPGLSQQVYIVDDDAAVRDSLTMLMRSVGLPTVSFKSGRDFLERFSGGPGVVVLDVRMPDIGGLELQSELQEQGRTDLPIIFISGHGDIPMAVEALKRGATDFVPKPFRDQELLDRVNKALKQNQSGMDESVECGDIETRIAMLTPREREVMTRVADGKANKVVAIELNISQRTVEIHRSHLMKKMGVRSVAHLVRMLDKVRFFDQK